MPSRLAAAKELAEVFKIVAHPDRIRLVEELRGGERDVSALTAALDLPGPRVSQHLALLRAHRLVEEHREGRRHLYRLSQPKIADWIVDGLAFVEARGRGVSKSKLEAARRLWLKPSDPAGAK